MHKFNDRQAINPQQNNYNDINTGNYYNHKDVYKNVQNVEIVRSKIVQNNNSSSTFTGYGNGNRVSSLQVSLQYDQQVKQNQNQLNLYSQKSQAQNQMIKTRNKINVISDNHSNISQSRDNQSSLNKRSGSVSRGGIRVTSRNSSFQKKSSTSIDKKNLQNPSTKENIPYCGLNCTTRNPFIQNQQNNEAVIIPNLRSLETLKSQATYTELLSERDKIRVKPTNNKYNQNFYQNISEATHIQPSPTNIKNLSYKQSRNTQNSFRDQNIYKNVRQMMQSQIKIAKKMYQKKYQDEIENLNIFYRSQIQTLQMVLGQNQTIIQGQGKKIQKLQQKIIKKQSKIEKYQQRFQSIRKFIDSSAKFTQQRLSEVQKKFQILLSQYQCLSNYQQNGSNQLNKLQYTKDIFSTMICQIITKYRCIQHEIKQDIKQMMKKYEYFQEKVYEMDLMKHLGKQNQIQNYKLIQKIQNIKERIVFIESNAKCTNLGSPKSVSHGEKSVVLDKQDHNLLRNQLQRISYQVQKCYKQKQLIETRISEVTRQFNTMKQNSKNLQQIQKSQQIKQKKYLEQHLQTSNRISQIERQNQSLKIQIKNLAHLIEQKQSKIQQYQFLIKELQNKNIILMNEQNNLIIEKNNLQSKIRILSSELSEKNKYFQTLNSNDQSNCQKLNQIILQKQNLLQDVISKLDKQFKQKQQISREKSELFTEKNRLQDQVQQLNCEKAQLNQALQMTQKVFDEQIIKFKQTIHKLQQENTYLLQQIDQSNNQLFALKQQLRKIKQQRDNNLSSSASSKNSENNVYKKIVLSKSPKKQVCQTVTMGWFKKNIQKQNIKEKHHSSSDKDFYNSPTSRNIPYDKVRQYSNDANKPLKKYNNTISPTSSNEEFFYPTQTMKQSYDSTSIMQSHPNIKNDQQLQYYKQIKNKEDKINQKSSASSINSELSAHTQPIKSNKQMLSTYSIQKKLLHLKQILEQNYQLPVQCILDRQRQLQIYQTGIYVVDQKYRAFQLLQNQVHLAQINKIVTILNEEEENEENYIY